MYITLVVASLLLLALAQSYASARKLKMWPAIYLSLAMLIIGDLIVYFIFIGIPFFRATYPPNFVFPNVAIYSYGFMLMIAFVVGTIYLIVQGKKEKPPVEVDTILDLMVFIIIGSIIGARAVYVITQSAHYAGENAPRMLLITEGGLSIHGGVIGAMLAGWIYTWAKGLDYWRMVDFCIVGVPLGMFFGRIGCFLNGCCFGYECTTDLPWKVHFPTAADWMTKRDFSAELAQLYDSGLAGEKQWRHPTQLYEALGALLIFWYLHSFKMHKVFKGHVFLMFVWLYSILRFIVEFYRFGDPEKGTGSSVVLWGFITLAQFASLILGFVAIILMSDLKRRAHLARLLSEGEEPEEEAVTVEEEIEEEQGEEEIEPYEVEAEQPAESMEEPSGEQSGDDSHS
jgi:phosphatidylglycerol:prolipoprotein diacylglycerol transferase